MKLPLIAAAAACLLSACSPLSRAMVPDLGQLEVRVKPKITCSSVAQRVAAAGPLEAAQIFALFGACEESQAGTMVDLQAGRDVGLPLVPN